MAQNKILISTERKVNTWPSWDLVYEWEDVLREALHTEFFYPRRLVLGGKDIGRKLYELTNFNINSIFQRGRKCFAYEMKATKKKSLLNLKGMTICIIDFFLRESELAAFFNAYKNTDAIYVSSREVYEFLKKNGYGNAVGHMPLTISDKYKITPNTTFNKEFDIALVGRQNPVLKEFLDRYMKGHNLRVAYRGKLENGNFPYYTTDGEFIGNVNTRQDYINLIRKSRIGLYTTPGIDGGEQRTNGFNQVTPRFLELIASGCHVLAKYAPNPDTKYFELDDMASSVRSYEDFEKAMDKALNESVNMKKYSDYLAKHYTSTIVDMIK